MAPEQASNSKAADIRSDIYSLGCTWYHMLTCQPPYPQGSVTNKLASHISGPIPDPRIINPKVPEAVVAIIHRMMAKKKEQRYQTPGELLEDLNSPGLKHGGGAPDLLAMLVEEGAAGVGRPGTAGPGGGSDSAFTVSKRPGGRATPGKGSSHQETRAEMASTDARAKLVRMDVGRSAGGDSGKNIPWGLIVLAGLVLAVIFTGMWISNTYAPAPPVQQPGSPYASGPDPNAVMRSNVPEPLPETPKPAPPPEPISGIPLPPGLAPPPNN
jgi:serine/threonine-protein kinase